MNLPRTLVLVALLPLAACASIVDGVNQTLSVQTADQGNSISGFQCTLKNNKGTWFTTTPGTVGVHRAYDALNVKCLKDGYNPAIVTVKSSTKGIAFGNILLGGIIGGAVDMTDGAAYDYPSLITVPVTDTTAMSATAAPTQPTAGK